MLRILRIFRIHTLYIGNKKREKEITDTRVRARKTYSDTVISVISVIRTLKPLKFNACTYYGFESDTVIFQATP